jgi:cytochrome c oxidase cbb3-type subunit 3
MGAPNLTDDVWLWGGRKEQIRETILYGRKNQMPAHNTLISADEARVVAGYVLSLSETESVATR